MKREKPTAKMNMIPTMILTDLDSLLAQAELIQAQGRQLENLARFMHNLKQQLREVEGREAPSRPDDLMRLAQAQHAAGVGHEDQTFFILVWLAERWADDIYESDPELKRLSAMLRAAEEREGLSDLREFDPDHPGTPADWKVLNAELDHRFQEVKKMWHDRFVRFLMVHGEPDMVAKYASDRIAFDRRREAGRLAMFGPLPGLGDAGFTKVVKKEV